CASTSYCKTVGQNKVIYTWNGTNWSPDNISSSSITLLGISCPTSSLCKTVGQIGVIYSWDGSVWSTDSSGTTQSFRGVSCPTTALCKAVGNSGIIRSWTSGTSWTVDTSGTTNTIYGVSCPTDTYCKAVGAGGIIRTWTGGTSWTNDTSGTTSNIFGISCTSPSFCKAVGVSGLMLSWNGTSWSTHTAITTQNLNGVSCASPSACKAVGAGGTILAWNGTIWSADSSSTSNILNGVSCPSNTLCKAAGNGGTILGMAQQTLTNVSSGFALNIFSDSGCMVTLTAEQFNTNHPMATVPLQTGRYWTLGSGTCTSGFSGSLTLPVLFTPDANDKVCRYPGSGPDWNCAANSFTATTITRIGITSFSDWTGGNDADPTALVLESLTVQTASRMEYKDLLIGLGLLLGGLVLFATRKRKRRSLST
ncbi:MAG TPA: hypothetical protein PK530_07295, partial [Anaerolineales bacterium]|nr:hypothetical protein [Anaerolineales bacterium]